MPKEYKLAMVGLGSIGKRHLKNINKILTDRNIKYSIDLLRRKNSIPLDELTKSMVNHIYIENDNIPNNYDAIFITNPTHLHYNTIKKFSDKSNNMFIEKPVFDKEDVELSNLSLKKTGNYYVACPLRYTEVIQYIKNNIQLDAVYSCRVICSSYLPDWRPGTDYRQTYSAHLEQGGGVSIDLIHEWDYIMYLFGMPKRIKNYRGKFSNLEIDSDDLSVYIAEYDNMLAEVHLDYFGKESIREVQLFTADDTIVADIIKSEIRFLKKKKTLKFNEDRNAYQIKEIINFFDILEGKVKNENDIYTALTTLKIAKAGEI